MNGFARFRPAAALIAAFAIAETFAPRAAVADAALDGPAAAHPSRAAASVGSEAGSFRHVVEPPPQARTITPPNRPLRSASKSGTPRKATTGSYWQTLLVLGGIVAVILAGAKYLRKHGPRLSGGIPADALEVLGKRAIDRGQLIYLVRLGSRILIIGSSSGGLQTLAEVTDPVEIDFLSGLCRQPAQSPGITQGFFALFNRQFAGSPPRQDHDPNSSATRSGEPPHVDFGPTSSIPAREEAHV
jgi:flagellar biogenesis protein FliO